MSIETNSNYSGMRHKQILYQVPKLRNSTTTTATATTTTTTTSTTTTWDHGGVPYEGPHENPRSLSSPKAEKYLAEKNLTDGLTE